MEEIVNGVWRTVPVIQTPEEVEARWERLKRNFEAFKRSVENGRANNHS